jgi:hypothetical protein
MFSIASHIKGFTQDLLCGGSGLGKRLAAMDELPSRPACVWQDESFQRSDEFVNSILAILKP